MAFSQFKSSKLKDLYETYISNDEKRWPVDSKNYYVKTCYGDTFVREHGEGEALVLLPGIQCSSLSYSRMIEGLSKEFKVYAVDIIGDYGRSYLSTPITEPRDYVLWLNDLFNKLKLGKSTNLMGTSMGAWLLSLYAAEYGTRGKLVLISPVGTVAPVSTQWMIKGLIMTALPFLKKKILDSTFKDFIKINPNAGEILENEVYRHGRIISKCFNPQRPQLPTKLPEEKLENIGSDILYFVGENETMYKAEEGIRYFNEHVKNGTVEKIQNTGHDLILINHEYIEKSVIKFLKKD